MSSFFSEFVLVKFCLFFSDFVFFFLILFFFSDFVFFF